MTAILVALTVLLFIVAEASVKTLGRFLNPQPAPAPYLPWGRMMLLYADGGQLQGRLCPECGSQLVPQDGPAGLDSPPLAECAECGWSEWEFNGEGLA